MSQAKRLEVFDRGESLGTFSSIGEAARHTGLTRITVRRALNEQCSIMRGRYTIVLAKPSSFPDKPPSGPVNWDAIKLSDDWRDLDTEGLSNLFNAMNEPCLCEITDSIRSRVAINLLRRYRYLRKTPRLSRERARSKATEEAEGMECLGHALNRWWKTFFTYEEAYRLIHKHPTIKTKGHVI